MSEKSLDCKGRHRSKTIAFRVSPEEDDVINLLVAASGMTKQDYITSRLECHDIVVNPDLRIYKLLKEQMKDLYIELRRMRSAEEMDERVIELLQALTQVFIDMGEEELKLKDNGVVQMDAAVFRMTKR